MARRRWVRWACMAAAAAVSAAVLVPNARLYRSEQSTGTVVAQLRHLRRELRSGAGGDMQRLFPEGYFFSHVLYGLTWVDVAAADPDRRADALREARWALDRLDGRDRRAPAARPGAGAALPGPRGRLGRRRPAATRPRHRAAAPPDRAPGRGREGVVAGRDPALPARDRPRLG